jgi:hypothetical protein
MYAEIHKVCNCVDDQIVLAQDAFEEETETVIVWPLCEFKQNRVYGGE